MELLTLGLLGLAIVGLVDAFRSRVSLARRLAHGALHDALTDLPNRAMLEDRALVVLARARRNGFKVAMLLLNVDQFREVNSSFGHGRGDELLKDVAERIRSCLREEDTLARVSGDEFAILLEQVEDETSPARVSERILKGMREPFDVAGRSLSMTATMGMVFSADCKTTPTEMFANAEEAMHRAKGIGRGRYEIFDASMSTTAKHRLTLETELRSAVENEELVVHYQPQFDLGSGRIVGFEGLLRWQHPTRGLLLPADFIPVAEKTGLIEPIGRWVLEEICHAGLRLGQMTNGGPRPTVAANVSGKQLQMEAEFEDVIVGALERSGLAPEELTLEITESVFVGSSDPSLEALKKVRDRGIGLAIDDFGIGYSSLSYLKYLPVSILKLDKTFVHGLDNHVDSEIVRSLLALASSLDITVCAEGIETSGQEQDVLLLGCQIGQGRFLSPPVSEESAAFLLASYSSPPDAVHAKES